MAFTAQEEAQIRQHLGSLSDNERKKHTQNPQAFLSFAGNFLGNSAAAYLLQKHGWPVLEREIILILKRL